MAYSSWMSPVKDIPLLIPTPLLAVASDDFELNLPSHSSYFKIKAFIWSHNLYAVWMLPHVPVTAIKFTNSLHNFLLNRLIIHKCFEDFSATRTFRILKIDQLFKIETACSLWRADSLARSSYLVWLLLSAHSGSVSWVEGMCLCVEMENDMG